MKQDASIGFSLFTKKQFRLVTGEFLIKKLFKIMQFFSLFGTNMQYVNPCFRLVKHGPDLLDTCHLSYIDLLKQYITLIPTVTMYQKNGHQCSYHNRILFPITITESY